MVADLAHTVFGGSIVREKYKSKYMTCAVLHTVSCRDQAAHIHPITWRVLRSTRFCRPLPDHDFKVVCLTIRARDSRAVETDDAI